eukprot:6454875-Lingulodinium_polyedra.AAC.1
MPEVNLREFRVPPRSAECPVQPGVDREASGAGGAGEAHPSEGDDSAQIDASMFQTVADAI